MTKEQYEKKLKLVNIIARCNCKDTQAKWLMELSEKGYECMESECTSCLIVERCTEVFSQHHPTPECKHCFYDNGKDSGYTLACNNRCTTLETYINLD